jgi:hypothetical protein
VTEDQSLVPAVHQQCADLGKQVDKYLLSGNTSGDPQFDQEYATERATILGEPAESRGALARAEADNAIQACDQKMSSDEAAAAAAAEAQAQAQAQAQADDAANVAYRSACSARHGMISTTGPWDASNMGGQTDPAGEYCLITYDGTSYSIPLLPDGTFDSDSAASRQSMCARELKWFLDGGGVLGKRPVWHADTGVCTENY